MAKNEDSPNTTKASNNQKMFVKAQVDLNVSLGQLLKVYEDQFLKAVKILKSLNNIANKT